MRSKSAADRSKDEDRAAICVPGAGTLHPQAALSLVRGAEPRAAGKMKPGLY